MNEVRDVLARFERSNLMTDRSYTGHESGTNARNGAGIEEVLRSVMVIDRARLERNQVVNLVDLSERLSLLAMNAVNEDLRIIDALNYMFEEFDERGYLTNPLFNNYLRVYQHSLAELISKG